ncbi:MAG: porin [Alphaproteobacteria bacterium]|nr:porin [Alphaproteobacteria bacterium]MCB1839473.1 porin [Alphaproteobacteria bacterium]
MKKLLMTSVAVAGLALAATPAHAEIDLEASGYFKGYLAYVNQDEATDFDTNSFDIIRDTEVHFTGEVTLDNGLIVGAHFETMADGDDGFGIDESYVYFSGDWGRFNFGAEDESAYLLQVTAPAADTNIDGIRQHLQPVNYEAMTGGLSGTFLDPTGNLNLGLKLDYAQDMMGKSDNITYLSPVFNGFQAGFTFAPDFGRADDFQGIGIDHTDTAPSANLDNADEVFGRGYSIAARYQAALNNLIFYFGGGWSLITLEDERTTAELAALNTGNFAYTDDMTAWNIGLDIDIGAFGIGANYSQRDHGGIVEGTAGAATTDVSDDEKILVVGADYTTGPFKLGLSWYKNDNTFGIKDLDTDRYSGGVTYEYGPGMTVRGSIFYVDHDHTDTALGLSDSSLNATGIVIGTQIDF